MGVVGVIEAIDSRQAIRGLHIFEIMNTQTNGNPTYRQQYSYMYIFDARIMTARQ